MLNFFAKITAGGHFFFFFGLEGSSWFSLHRWYIFQTWQCRDIYCLTGDTALPIVILYCLFSLTHIALKTSSRPAGNLACYHRSQFHENKVFIKRKDQSIKFIFACLIFLQEIYLLREKNLLWEEFIHGLIY